MRVLLLLTMVWTLAVLVGGDDPHPAVNKFPCDHFCMEVQLQSWDRGGELADWSSFSTKK